MSHQTVIHIYNFIRKSHEEPSRFIQDDFDTLKNQLMLMKQYGLPGTYALKHDALIDPRYISLLAEYLDETDEIGAWWEITEELCTNAGVAFRGKETAIHNNRVNSAYALGYLPEERCALVDAYMKDFYDILHFYPKSMGSWVMDIVTLTHAHETYGVAAGALCRDQMATDGFTLWGGYPNGAYYPSKHNEYIPAQTAKEQLLMPVFRLLGPDPIRCFEEQVRDSVMGVYTLEPSCTEGRNPAFIHWMFDRLLSEDTIGMAYEQVGQENNFLWENMKAGLEIQVKHVHKLCMEGKLRVETMAQTAAWFTAKYRLTPPMTYNASMDYQEGSDLKTMWYACRNYRISFLAEGDELFIRDWFVYRDDYKSRYLHAVMEGSDSLFDALPLMFPQLFTDGEGRAKVSLCDNTQKPLSVQSITFTKEGEDTGILRFTSNGGDYCIRMTEDGITTEGDFSLFFNRIPPLYACKKNRLMLNHQGQPYGIVIQKGQINPLCMDSQTPSSDWDKLPFDSFIIDAVEGGISLDLADYEHRGIQRENFLQPAYLTDPESIDQAFIVDCRTHMQKKVVICAPPVIHPGDVVCTIGEKQLITMDCSMMGAAIHYTTDGTQPTSNSPIYKDSFYITQDTCLCAIASLSTKEGQLTSTVTKATILYGLKPTTIKSETTFDPRKVFNKNGAYDLLKTNRGSLDYQDGNWLGNLDILDITVHLEENEWVHEIVIGFITHHRVGILYPHLLKIWYADENGIMQELSETVLPRGPYGREIEKTDFVFPIGKKTSALRMQAVPYEVFPDWCCYKGMSWVFTMCDNVIIR